MKDAELVEISFKTMKITQKKCWVSNFHSSIIWSVVVWVCGWRRNQLLSYVIITYHRYWEDIQLKLYL